MTGIDSNTEQAIFKAARNVFTHKGLSGARMQEIADEAGINKALLHYYFRSKDKLFEAIFRDVIRTFFPQIVTVIISDLPLFDKIRLFVDYYTDLLIQNPEIPGFIFHEVSLNPERFVGNIKEIGVDLSVISAQIQKEAEAGVIFPVKAEHFVANLISMCVFPFIARPVLKGITGFTDEQYLEFLRERKEIIPFTIIQSIRKIQ